MIYRENGRRYIPIKFSVRGRDLATTIQDLQRRLLMRSSYRLDITTPGPESSIAYARSRPRLPFIIPVSLVAILILLYIQFRTWKDALIVLGTLALWGHWWCTGIVLHPHAIQYFGRGWIHFAYWSGHPGGGRFSLGHSPRPIRMASRRG